MIFSSLTRLVLVAAVSIVCAGVATAATAADPAPAIDAPPGADPAAGWTNSQKASYLIGLRMAEQIKPFAEEFDVQKLLQAFQDALADKHPMVDMAQFQQVVGQFQQELQAKESKKGEGRKDVNAKWLTDNAKKPGVKTTASGLQYEVMTAGQGKVPTAADTVKVHYRGTLTNGKEFDSSYKRGEPAEFQVGGVIKGWTEALQLMHEGDKYKLYIPSELAYGEHGPPGIGDNQVLIFEVELLSVQGAAPAPGPGPAPAPAPKK